MKCSNWYEYEEQDNWEDILVSFNYLIVGNHFGIDDRCSFLGEKFKMYGKKVHQFKVTYPSSNNSSLHPCFYLDEDEITTDNLNEFISDIETGEFNILLDISTFDLPELYHFLDSCNEILSSACIAYSEPKNYTKENIKDNSGNEYLLSKDGNGIDYLSSCDILPSLSKRYLISIGYESHRLAGFLSSDEIQMSDRKSVVLGVPPFNVGWEHHTIKNNYKILAKHDVGIHIAPADDPIQTYLKVFETYQQLKQRQNLVLMPIGPKPQALGMIWFALNKNKGPIAEVGVQYDFVQKVQKRTSGISKVHLWNFKFK